MSIQIGKRREFVWDSYMIDEEKTTAERRVHEPVRRGTVITFDKPWEGDGCNYFCVVHDDEKGVYRLYYNAWEMLSADKKTHTTQCVKVCCIESRDGLHWERPSLGKVEFDGSRSNNILIMPETYPGLEKIDNFFVTVDKNPHPAVPGRFKAVMLYPEKMEDGSIDRKLMALAGDDGYHFRKVGVVTREGKFDTLNTVMWHEATGQYICYIRDFHQPGTWAEFDGGDLNSLVRDIRVLFSGVLLVALLTIRLAPLPPREKEAVEP